MLGVTKMHHHLCDKLSGLFSGAQLQKYPKSCIVQILEHEGNVTKFMPNGVSFHSIFNGIHPVITMPDCITPMEDLEHLWWNSKLFREMISGYGPSCMTPNGVTMLQCVKVKIMHTYLADGCGGCRTRNLRVHTGGCDISKHYTS